MTQVKVTHKEFQLVNLDSYQEATDSTAIYPDAGTGSDAALAERRARRQAAGVPRGRKLLYPNAATPANLRNLENSARAADAVARSAERKGDARADQLRARADQLRARANAARIDVIGGSGDER